MKYRVQKYEVMLILGMMPIDQFLLYFSLSKIQSTYILVEEFSYKDADTDQKNLDFVEQESGTKHERDVDLQQAQAEGNIQLERVKQAGQTQEGNVTELESYLSEKNTG